MFEPNPVVGEYQSDAIAFMSERKAGAIFLAMGTGKTYVVIEWLKSRLRAQDYSVVPVLIAAPKSVCHTWEQELEKFGNGVKWKAAYDGPPTRRAEAVKEAIEDLEAHVLLVNYEYLPKLVKSGTTAATVVFDESTRIKNTKANRSKAAYELAGHANFRWVLTGNPIPRGMEDIYGQIFATDKGKRLGESYWQFLNRYFTPISFGTGKRGWVPKRNSMGRVKEQIRDIVFSRPREECVTLPEKRYRTVLAEMPPKVKVMVQEVMDYWRLNGVEVDNRLTVDLWLRMLCLGFDREWSPIDCNKYKVLLETLEDIGKEQVVIWTNFIAENYRVADTVARLNAPYVQIYGEVPNDDRRKRLEEFERGDRRYCIISTQVGAFGLNELRHCDYIIYFSNGYDYELRAQSEDRSYRVGRTRQCTYTDIITGASIEGLILKNLKGKEHTSKSFIRDRVMTELEQGGLQCELSTLKPRP